MTSRTGNQLSLANAIVTCDSFATVAVRLTTPTKSHKSGRTILWSNHALQTSPYPRIAFSYQINVNLLFKTSRNVAWINQILDRVLLAGSTVERESGLGRCSCMGQMVIYQLFNFRVCIPIHCTALSPGALKATVIYVQVWMFCVYASICMYKCSMYVCTYVLVYCVNDCVYVLTFSCKSGYTQYYVRAHFMTKAIYTAKIQESTDSPWHSSG